MTEIMNDDDDYTDCLSLVAVAVLPSQSKISHAERSCNVVPRKATIVVLLGGSIQRLQYSEKYHPAATFISREAPSYWLDSGHLVASFREFHHVMTNGRNLCRQVKAGKLGIRTRTRT